MRLLLGCVLALVAIRPSHSMDVHQGAVDLSAFDALEPSCGGGSALPANAADVGNDDRSGGSRFYIAGIVGGSFATLANPDLPAPNSIVNQSLFTGGAAVGRAFDRGRGEWRAEVEARGRERMQFVDSDPVAGSLTLRADDGWSTMANLWREYRLRERIGLYLGGGVGAGGYRCVFDGNVLDARVSGSTAITSFAWQAGGGGTYALSDRVIFDVGYRFFSLESGSADIFVSTEAGAVGDSVPTQFSAGELLLSLRIYEPFRRWR